MKEPVKYGLKQGSLSCHGMTIVELIITMFLLLMVGGALLWMLVAGESVVKGSVTRVSGNQDIQVITSAVEEDLRYTNANAIVVNSGSPRAIGILSAYDQGGAFITDSTGAPVWQKCVVYYIPVSTTRFIRKEVYGAFTAPPSASDLISYCDGKGRQLSSSVKAFSLTVDIVKNSAILRVSVQNTNANGKSDIQSGTASIHFCN